MKIGVIGAGGRMGQKILGLLNENKNIQITAAIDVPNSKLLGQKVFSDLDLVYSSDLNSVVSFADVFIDFTAPAATINNLKIISDNKKAIVIGTTGFSDEQISFIKETSKKIPIVFSPNMSIGVNDFLKFWQILRNY